LLKKLCKLILKENPDAELVAILGSVALGDIIAWFSDIDLLAIGESLPEKEKFMVLEHEFLFIEYHSWRSFENLLTRRIAYDEYESRSSYLFYYSDPFYLYSSEGSRTWYAQILKNGLESLWEDHKEIDRYLDDFVWFYGASLEALRNGMTMTALGKLQRALTYLLQYFLVKNKILLRKPLPDERTLA